MPSKLIPTVSSSRKEKHTQDFSRNPVLLTAFYNQQEQKHLIQLALNMNIKICTRIDITSPNEMRISEDFTLSPDQIRQIYQVQPTPVEIYIIPPKFLADHLPEIIRSNVGINGLLIDKIEADSYLALKQPSAPISQFNINSSNRPSENCYSKTEIFYLELENILLSEKIDPLNRSTLWNTLVNKIESDPQSKFSKQNIKLIREKESLKLWDLESSKDHLKKVIDWYNNLSKT